MITFYSCDVCKYKLKKYFPSFLMGFYIKSFSRTQLEQDERQSRSKQVLLSQYPDSSIPVRVCQQSWLCIAALPCTPHRVASSLFASTIINAPSSPDLQIYLSLAYNQNWKDAFAPFTQPGINHIHQCCSCPSNVIQFFKIFRQKNMYENDMNNLTSSHFILNFLQNASFEIVFETRFFNTRTFYLYVMLKIP